LIAGLSLANELKGIRIKDVGSVEILRRRIDLFLAALRHSHVEIPIELIMRVISGVSVKFVKASVDWTGLRVHVPFADKVASVSEWIEQFRNGRALTIETTKITGASSFVWLIGGKVPDAGLGGIQPSHKRCSAWATSSRIIELSEA
jgi:hypothetical protein